MEDWKRLPLALLAAALLFAVTPSKSSGGPLVQDSALNYRITAEVNGANWGEWTVTQGAQLEAARWVDSAGVGDVALVAGPAAGGLPAQPSDDFGGLLSGVFDPAARFGPGFWKASTFGSGTAVVDSMSVELHDGNTVDQIDGHEARRHMLSARVWWRHKADEGSETPVFETGTAELWFVPQLPFSWLPFAVHPATPGLALPLAHSWPEVGWSIVRRYGERFRRLGLLVRARVTDEISPHESPESTTQLVGTRYERTIHVSDIAPAAQPPAENGYGEWPRLARSRSAVLQTVMFLLEPCRSLAGAAGSFEFGTTGPRSYIANGSGAVFHANRNEDDAYAIVTGNVVRDRAECTALIMPGNVPREGSFSVVAPSQAFAQPPVQHTSSSGHAIGVHFYAEGRTIERILVLDGGTVRIDAVGPRSVSGKLDGTAWGVELDPNHKRQLFDGFGVRLTFKAVPAAAVEAETR